MAGGPGLRARPGDKGMLCYNARCLAPRPRVLGLMAAAAWHSPQAGSQLCGHIDRTGASGGL